MNSFLKLIASIIKQADEPTSTHSSFRIVDSTAIGENPIREVSLDVVPLGDDSNESIVTLAWKDSAEKILEKKTSSEEASHLSQLLQTDLAQLVKLTDENKYDEAKETLKNMLKTYAQDTSTPTPTNLPPLHNTQAELDIDVDLWKQAAQVKVQNVFPSGTIQNLTFENQEDLSAYMGKQKGNVPLWEQEGKGAPEEKSNLVAPSLSYEEVEQQKEEEHESLKDHMDATIKKELESALQEKAASVFGPDQVELVKVLRQNGRNWDEVKKLLTKDFHFDKDAVTIFVDQQRQEAGDEGIEIKKEEPSPLKPPENLVSPATHEKLLEDLKKDHKPEGEPIEETKEIEKVDEAPIIEESAKKSICPECNGEGDVPAVRGGHVVAISCPSCSGDKHIQHVPKELESAIEEISRADNGEIRKQADEASQEIAYEHAVDRLDKKLMKGIIHQEEYDVEMENLKKQMFPNEIDPNKHLWSSLKQKVASYMNISETDPIEKVAVDTPLTEPIQEEPTMETPEQDRIPFGQDGHRAPKPESWVIVGADLKGELPAFRGKFVSEETESDGTKWGIVDRDGELLKVEMHRITPETEGAQTTEPTATPQIDTNIEQPVNTIPSTEKLTSLTSELKEVAYDENWLSKIPCEDCRAVSSGHDRRHYCGKHEPKETESFQDDLLTIKAEAEQLLKLVKEAEGEQETFWDERSYDEKYPMMAKYPEVVDKIINAIKEHGDNWYKVEQKMFNDSPFYMMNLSHEVGSREGGELITEVYKWLAEHDKSEDKVWTPRTYEDIKASLKQANSTYVDGKGWTGGSFASGDKVKIIGDSPFAGQVGTIQKQTSPSGKVDSYVVDVGSSHHEVRTDQLEKVAKQASDFEKGISQNKTADEPAVEPKTILKDVKITPDYVEKEKALPATDEQSQVISKLQAIESNLATLDRAKEEMKAKLMAELKKIDDAAERSTMEREYQEQINKLGILIKATQNQVIKDGNMFYSFKNQEVKVVPDISKKEWLEKFKKRYEDAEKFINSVKNGIMSLAKSVVTPTVTRWPEKRSELAKEASVSDQLTQMNNEMLEALKLLSQPL